MTASATHGIRLSTLLAGLIEMPLVHDPEIRGITLDSRTVQQGWLFIAVPGARTDGRAYIAGAYSRGAAATVYEVNGFEPDARSANAIGVRALRQHIGAIADRFYGAPSRKLKVVGVTGTNGKTTTTHLLAQVLDRPDARCGLIGTLGSGFPGQLDPSLHTTPDAVSVHRLMAEFVAAGAKSVCMEVSSHALDQARVAGVTFDIAVFTNLTRDHLDYHGDMAAYAAAKARLFDFPHLKAAVINQDDAFGRELIERTRGRVQVLSFGLRGGDVRALAVETSPAGLALTIATPHGETPLRSPLLGRFNAANLLAVLAVLLVAGVPLAEAANALARALPVAGRMERFGGKDAQPLVVVDYAHTPDALEKVLQALREHTHGKLVCVFGCGGDRDRGKRPQMGRIAEQLADVVILTNDNPRHEDPVSIINEIISGMQATPSIVPDRVQAIRVALSEARTGDIVLVAGKGHEDYQQFGEQRLAYSDRDTVRALLRAAA
ncbi:MAG: UDP-N-acetylmuramoyl-L-alanyl-D-glutamate--2,6-diaminopimelate ligase [Pseudomonadota bacterium]